VRYIAHRVLLYVPMLLLLTLMVFLLMRVIPGDPALLILAGTSGDGSFTKAISPICDANWARIAPCLCSMPPG
jgi:ABC-type dipeptide/oligopeptide/nickel transport system permease component